jgi:hypothetical protein
MEAAMAQAAHDTLNALYPSQAAACNQILAEDLEENGQSRIYLGIHFAFDKNDGIAQGERIGNYVFSNVLTRERGRRAR